MAKVVAVEHVTLDSVMQGPGRPDEDSRDGFAHGGWGAARGADPVLQQAIGGHMAGGWSLLLGRTTYEQFHAHWPHQVRPNQFADALDAVEKFVASTTLAEPLAWQHSKLLPGDAADAVAELRASHAHNLVIFGSGVLVRSLLRRNLIDVLLLQIHPLVLGTGRRLFDDTSVPAHFTLTESVTTAGGVIVATYTPAAEH